MMPKKCLDGRSPDEAMTGRKPDVSILRTFGCDALVRVPKERRAKGENKAQIVTFLYYKEGIKPGWTFRTKETKRIISSGDAVFHEGDWLPQGVQSMDSLTFHKTEKDESYDSPSDSEISGNNDVGEDTDDDSDDESADDNDDSDEESADDNNANSLDIINTSDDEFQDALPSLCPSPPTSAAPPTRQFRSGQFAPPSTQDALGHPRRGPPREARKRGLYSCVSDVETEDDQDVPTLNQIEDEDDNVSTLDIINDCDDDDSDTNDENEIHGQEGTIGFNIGDLQIDEYQEFNIDDIHLEGRPKRQGTDYEKSYTEQLLFTLDTKDPDGDNPTLKQAMNGPDAALWEKAKESEEQSLSENKTYGPPCTPPIGKT